MARNKVAVVEFDNSHGEALATFVRQVWDPMATPRGVLRARTNSADANPSCTNGRIPTVMFLLNGAVVGHITTIPERISLKGRVRQAYWMVGFHVLPQYRNGPIGVMVAKELLRVAPATLTLTVEDVPLRIFRQLGYRHLGVVPNYARLVRPAAVARRLDPIRLGIVGSRAWLKYIRRIARRTALDVLGAVVVNMATGVWVRFARPRATAAISVAYVDLGCWDRVAGYDELWKRLASRIGASPVRDAARMRWRFVSHSEQYFLIEAHDNGDLLGYCVINRPRSTGDPRLAGIRVAPIADLLFPPEQPEVGCALLAAAERWIKKQDVADTIVASSPHAGIRRVLKRSGYIRFPGNLKLVVHPALFDMGAKVQFGEWWLNRGDCNADEVM